VDAEDGVDPIDAALLDHAQGSTGRDLLGRLEDQADAEAPCHQRVSVFLQGQPGPEDRCDMDVMTTGMAHPLGL
jgi:hypothetical protein